MIVFTVFIRDERVKETDHLHPAFEEREDAQHWLRDFRMHYGSRVYVEAHEVSQAWVCRRCHVEFGTGEAKQVRRVGRKQYR